MSAATTDAELGPALVRSRQQVLDELCGHGQSAAFTETIMGGIGSMAVAPIPATVAEELSLPPGAIGLWDTYNGHTGEAGDLLVYMTERPHPDPLFGLLGAAGSDAAGSDAADSDAADSDAAVRAVVAERGDAAGEWCARAERAVRPVRPTVRSGRLVSELMRAAGFSPDREAALPIDEQWLFHYAGVVLAA
jgi:hypothetical protein